jgi:uncharacterized membrane protein
MKWLRLLLAFWIWLIPMGLTSCGCLGGGSGGTARVETTTKTTTLGKELMDLDEAYKKGIISEDEYNKKKKELMKKDK